MKSFNFLYFMTFCLLLTGCGKESGQSGLSIPDALSNPATVDIDDGIDGQYLAVFDTLNPEITGKITGAFTFSRDKLEDELVADVRLTNGGPHLIHPQYVRLGGRCPTMIDDANGDGIIDAMEGEAVYGKIFFPLDGDITSQASHDGEFPVGDVYGNYIYSRLTTFGQFVENLRIQDQDDGYVKLKKNEPLKIEGRVVVVHGIDKTSELPETVRATDRRSPHQSLPIACGVINQVILVPGEIEPSLVR